MVAAAPAITIAFALLAAPDASAPSSPREECQRAGAPLMRMLEMAQFQKEPEGSVRTVFEGATKAAPLCPHDELVAYLRLRGAELGKGALVGALDPSAREQLRRDADEAAVQFPGSARILTIDARASGTVSAARRAVDEDGAYAPAKVALAAALVAAGDAQTAVKLLGTTPKLDATSDGFTVLARARLAVHDLRGAIRATRSVFTGRQMELIEPDAGNRWPVVEAHEIAGLAALELRRYDDAARHLLAADFGSAKVHDLLDDPPPPLRRALHKLAPLSKK